MKRSQIEKMIGRGPKGPQRTGTGVKRVEPAVRRDYNKKEDNKAKYYNRSIEKKYREGKMKKSCKKQ